ncbi:MAG: cupin domain-containing protein [Sneathiella sp.]|uniref:cupin domain-containing protein n=1 Tax=Sneathiella sp. TaxID=1964365 RepID=UPI00300360D5
MTSHGAIKKAKIDVFDMASTDWVNVGKEGLFYKPARVDLDSGKFLGLFRFDAFAESGLHQHEDVGASYILSGSVTDYAGTFTQGCVGINPPGDTHDAFSYEGVLIVSRLEGSSKYPMKDEQLSAIHPGAHRDQFPEIAAARDPIVVPYKLLDIIPSLDMPEGVTQRVLYDYTQTNHDFRMTSLHLDPGAKIPSYSTVEKQDIFIIAGDLVTGGVPGKSNQFITLAPETEVELTSNFGCHILVWSDAPVSFNTYRGADPFGF